MTTRVNALHGFDEAHVLEVMDEMRRLGAPTVRAINVGANLMAVEGSHRLEAARRLGLVPVVELVAGSDEDMVTGLDLDDRDTWTVGELREYLERPPHGDVYDAELG